MDLPVQAGTIEAPAGEAATGLPAALLNCLLRMLIAALPLQGLSPETAAETEEAARAMFFGMEPRDPAEAAAASRAVAAHFACMQVYARAARPGLSDETAARLHATANACLRAAEAAQRSVRKPQPAPPKAVRQKAMQPEARPHIPIVEVYQFQPRDRFGQPIPLGEWEKMTMAQRRATYAPTRDPAVEAEAIADEEAMIAEQKALDAAKEREAAGDKAATESQVPAKRLM